MTKKEFLTIAVIISLLAIFVYLPSFRIHFSHDAVDFYGGLCASLGNGTFIEWILRFANGHLSIIPTICYYINWRFFERSIVSWHIFSLFLHTVSIFCVFDIFTIFIKKKEIVIFLAFIFATSAVFNHMISDTNCLNHLCAVTFTLLSLACLSRYLLKGKRLLYALSLVFAFSAFTSSAFGLIIFPAHIVFLWSQKSGKEKMIEYFISITMTIATFGLFWFLGTKGANENHFNLMFGIQQTFYGISKRTVPKMLEIKILGIFLFIFAITNMIKFSKKLNWRYMLTGIFLATIPLLMASSFREDFVNPGNWPRYHYIPLIGTLIVLGQGLSTPNMDHIILFFRQKHIGRFIIIIFVIATVWLGHSNIFRLKTYIELREYENLLGEACMEYSKIYNTKTVMVPNIRTSLPHFPIQYPKDLIYICRYSTPYTAKLNFEVLNNDIRLLKILQSNDKYKPIIERLMLSDSR